MAGSENITPTPGGPKQALPPKGFLTWYGGIHRLRDLHLRGGAFLGPGLLWLSVFLALPTLGLLALSFARRGDFGDISWAFTLENYRRLLGYGLFGWSPDYLIILGRSLWVGLVTTALCALLAYPLTFYIASRPPKTRTWLLFLLVVPFWTNVVVRTYAWLLILSPQLPPAKIMAFLGFIPAGAPLYPGSVATFLGMVATFLPFMALPLYSSVERLNWELLEAARDLYASRWQVFTQAILPQTRPGLTVGVIVTFIPAMAMFVVTDLLGGAKYMLIGNLIQHQFGQSRDWPFGAALCLALMFLTMLGLIFYRRYAGGEIGAAGSGRGKETRS
ncbi:MAG: ABC transporter permease [Candidatus Adiutrix sp.]|jgi:spermidine/putrescine transport system permease protein|nr:ABC transporter permease [Candidatus Adiutrix sp.]